ncbi:hypothetical protein EV291_13055 [Rhizobium sp. BK068]|nr:hypothetical protein EV291_13055 [Rhizobium sp. BK068]
MPVIADDLLVTATVQFRQARHQRVRHYSISNFMMLFLNSRDFAISCATNTVST